MKQAMMVLVAASVLVSGSALASADMAKAKNCMACHAVQTKLVGPAFKDVAAKYSGQKGIEDKLVAKIIKGGSGSWGAIPMPANPQVSDAEAKALAKWIMAQK